MKRVYWLTIMAASLLFAAVTGQAAAQGYGGYSGLSVEVISDERGVLPEYDAEGRDGQRSYVAARNDERYRIRVQNHGNNRIGLVIAVDGRNIISGDRSQLEANERMYILEPYQTGEYDGWRTGKNRVNRFYFTGMSDSYAAAWGDYSAMGVIAVAAYHGRRQNFYVPPKSKGNKNQMDRPTTRGMREEPGTGFGESESSPSRTVEFRPEDRPFAREFIKYEWTSTLCKRGIINCREEYAPGRRNRFWQDSPRNRDFAPFPPFRPFR